MKQLLIYTGMLVAIFCAALGNTVRVENITDQIAGHLEEAEAAVIQGDWEKADGLTEEAHQEWEKAEAYFCIVLRHADTDEVSNGFQEVIGFLQWQDEAEYTSTNHALIKKVRHLAEVEGLTWANLL